MEKAEKKSLWQTVRENACSFMETVRQGPDVPYFLLVMCYILAEYLMRINWTEDLYTLYEASVLNILVIFGCGAYLCFKITAWKKLWQKPVLLVLLILGVGGLTAWLFLYLNESWRLRRVLYTVVVEIFLCLMANGKNFKRLLQCLVVLPILTLVIAWLAVLAGDAQEFAKVGAEDTTRSFGIIYPNTWGYIAFQAMLMIWYLWLRKKLTLTFVLFWGMALFMYFVVGCRTIAVLSVLLPLAALVVGQMEKRERRPGKKPGIFALLIIALPVLCYVFSIAASTQMSWVKKTFYSTPLYSFSMRFVQGGIALDEFGFPLIGRSMATQEPVIRIINGAPDQLYVLDNAYSSFTILKGVLWIIACLAWLCYGQWRGWKQRDYRILLIGSFMLIFAIMERPGLEVWYNFVLLYPLASLAEPAPIQLTEKKTGAGKKQYSKKKKRK